DRALEDYARLLQGRRDHVWIVAFPCRTLMEEIAIRAPCFQCGFHRWSGNREIEEAQRGLVGLQFSRHQMLTRSAYGTRPCHQSFYPTLKAEGAWRSTGSREACRPARAWRLWAIQRPAASE